MGHEDTIGPTDFIAEDVAGRIAMDGDVWLLVTEVVLAATALIAVCMLETLRVTDSILLLCCLLLVLDDATRRRGSRLLR